MDLICFSHIRWDFVYQRPQHLMSRFALYNRVFVIEEPIEEVSDFYKLRKDSETNNLWIIQLYVSKKNSIEKRALVLRALIDSLFHSKNVKEYMLWYYTPMALEYSNHLHPSLIIYDCMDELSAFKFAPPELKKIEGILLKIADVVFTGGHSLYEAKKYLHHNVHSFPSSIDKLHFQSARIKGVDPLDQAKIPYPRFGFYGVIDERFHISLISELARRRADWHFIFIGPVIKIDPSILPAGENIHYLGSKNYSELPSYLSEWDVAIIPFELNESTKYISPTKTPEYLAGGKPVISTSITDVISPYAKLGLVHIADTAEEFIVTAEKILTEKNNSDWKLRVDKYLENISWNKTWHKMTEVIEEALDNKFKIPEKKEIIYV